MYKKTTVNQNNCDKNVTVSNCGICLYLYLYSNILYNYNSTSKTIYNCFTKLITLSVNSLLHLNKYKLK